MNKFKINGVSTTIQSDMRKRFSISSTSVEFKEDIRKPFSICSFALGLANDYRKSFSVGVASATWSETEEKRIIRQGLRF
ncbi:MAG: hypothetical protein FWF54_01350 [Candidatus Azobacteroides sp.]|nr:hypothetical protein [Candidatus Azobacteroides sp.]